MDQLSRLLNECNERMNRYRISLMQKSSMPVLTLRQFHYLDAIRKMKNPTLTHFSDSLGITKPSANEAVRKLIDFGYVEKSKDDLDARSIRLRLTKQGLHISKINHDAAELFSKEIESRISKRSANSLSRILKKAL